MRTWLGGKQEATGMHAGDSPRATEVFLLSQERGIRAPPLCPQLFLLADCPPPLLGGQKHPWAGCRSPGLTGTTWPAFRVAVWKRGTVH